MALGVDATQSLFGKLDRMSYILYHKYTTYNHMCFWKYYKQVLFKIILKKTYFTKR